MNSPAMSAVMENVGLGVGLFVGSFLVTLAVITVIQAVTDTISKWRERRRRTARELERLHRDTTASVERLQTAFWQAREHLREESKRHGQ